MKKYKNVLEMVNDLSTSKSFKKQFKKIIENKKLKVIKKRVRFSLDIIC